MFFIVTNASLMLYKMKGQNSSLKLIKNYQSPVAEYSFESTEGVLALVSPAGRVSLYYLYQVKGSKNYAGSSFDLSLDKGISRPLCSGPKSGNLLKFILRLDCNQFQCSKIYEFCYFIHLDNLNGRVYLFRIFKDRVPDVLRCYSIPQGIYGMGVTENLLFIQSYNTQETFIYDIQSRSEEFIIRVNHSESTSSSINPRKSAEFSVKIELNSEFFFVSEEITVDLRSCSIRTLRINPVDLIENHPDNQKIILFLLRREKCKVQILEKLKESLLFLTPISKLKIIFSTLASAYASAQDEKIHNNTISRLENIHHAELAETDVDPSVEVKSENGITVIVQADIYYFVFDPVYKSIENRRYLSEALICYTHFLIQQGVSVHFSIQYLLFKILIKIEDFNRVQKLIENKFFTDSQDIALFLISLSKTQKVQKFPFCFVLGIDMLQRLKLLEVVARELCDQGYNYEAVDFSLTRKINISLSKSIAKDLGMFSAS